MIDIDGSLPGVACHPRGRVCIPVNGRFHGKLHIMIRIANAQGFWGDSLEAPLDQLRGGPIDYLTLDYLAEVTMSILQKQFTRDPQAGYARDFPQMIERGAKEIVERGVKVVANAGGVNPETCGEAVAAALARAG